MLSDISFKFLHAVQGDFCMPEKVIYLHLDFRSKKWLAGPSRALFFKIFFISSVKGASFPACYFTVVKRMLLKLICYKFHSNSFGFE